MCGPLCILRSFCREINRSRWWAAISW